MVLYSHTLTDGLKWRVFSKFEFHPVSAGISLILLGRRPSTRKTRVIEYVHAIGKGPTAQLPKPEVASFLLGIVSRKRMLARRSVIPRIFIKVVESKTKGDAAEGLLQSALS